MNSRYVLLFATLLCIVTVIAGCTGTQNAPAAATPSSQPSAAGTPASTSSASLVPTETDSLDAARSVTVNIEKDHLGTIIATFQGGAGLIHVRKIDVTLNRADGQTKTASVGIKAGDSASLEGTKQTDRCIVYVTLDDGKSYKIFDDLIPYKPR